MMDKNMEGALKRVEEYYPTKDFNADLMQQKNDVLAKCDEIKAKFVPHHFVVYHFDEKGKKRSSIVLFQDGLPEETDEKFNLFSAIGQEMSAMTSGVLSAFFVSESWVVRQDKNGKIDLSIRPSENPNRQEVIVIVGCTVDQRSNQIIIPIVSRNEEGALKLGEPEVHESDGKGAEMTSPLFEGFWAGYALSLLKKLGIKEKSQAKPEAEQPESGHINRIKGKYT